MKEAIKNLQSGVYLGNCYELIKEIPDKSIDLIYTDIPYDFVNGGGGGCFGLKNRSYLSEIKLDERINRKIAEYDEKMKNATTKYEYEKWHCRKSKFILESNTKGINTGIDFKILDDLVRVMKHIHIYIWCSKLQIPYIFNYFIEKGCNFEILVWCKTNPTPLCNNTFLPDIEYCLMFREKGVRLNDGFNLKSKWYISGKNVSDKKEYEHPTIKPLDLVKRHIKLSTQQNDIVFDPFAGSGTTLKACKDLNRRYIGFEINERYYEIARDRLENINAKGEIKLF